MRLAVALTNVGLGSVYTSYGIMTIWDLRRGWATRGQLHFGLAWIAMAFTCGPHHLEHGLHLLVDQRPGGGLDLLAVVVGIPAGATWFGLRVEAFRGGRGDRVIVGTPGWVRVLPFVAVAYGLLAMGAAAAVATEGSTRPVLIPNVWLVVLYMLIGYWLTRTQLMAHATTGTWSLSGLSLAIVFPTCALMHAAWAAYATAGTYAVHGHLLVIDWLAVPAALYFVWVVRALYTGELTSRAVAART